MVACIGIASAGASTAAYASAGCDAVNAGGFDVSGQLIAVTINSFAAGDTVNFTITSTLNGPTVAWSLLDATSSTLGLSFIPGGMGGAGTPWNDLKSYTVTGTNDTTLEQISGSPGGTTTITATCTPASSSGGTDSDKVRSVQIVGSQIVSQNSGAAIDGAVTGAIDGAFGNGAAITPNGSGVSINFTAEPRSEIARRADQAFAALGYAGPVKAPAPRTRMWQPWSVWADIRGTGFDGHGSSDIDGHQVNMFGGVGYKFMPNMLAGVFVGYETFNYDIASLTGSFDGHGVTIGSYFAWRFAQNLRWDAALAHSWMSYDASAGTASGSFDGSRWFLSTGLTGTYRYAAFILEPSAKVFALWEDQDAWTDSLGTAQASRSFSAGRLSLGGKVSRVWGDWNGFQVTPSVGLYGDWRFASDNALPAGTTVVGIDDGWSARVTGGLNFASARGCTLTLAAEYGGIGADYGIWSGTAHLNLPF